MKGSGRQPLACLRELMHSVVNKRGFLIFRGFTVLKMHAAQIVKYFVVNPK